MKKFKLRFVIKLSLVPNLHQLRGKDELFCTETSGYASMNICKVKTKDFCDEKHLPVMIIYWLRLNLFSTSL